MKRITKYDVREVAKICSFLANEKLTVWNDGGCIVVSCGEGEPAKALAARIVNICDLKVEINRSSLNGSIADIEAKKARGIRDATYLLIYR